ncbi:MAG: hypothetical protein H6734_18260 [Alphaproteobacteria bacterium]|nr:hypothetical protein [Alphaproteobacteria bacterium]
MFSLVLFHLMACDDTLWPVAEPTGEGWCGVQSLLGGECLTCHSAASALGGLDLETDPTAVLTFTGPTGQAFVVPGDHASSFLYRKLAGTDLAAGEGTVMPPSGSPSAEILANLATWIDDGATIDTSCTGGGETPRFHPVGWADPDVHGTEAKLRTDATLVCTSCHGEALEGGTGPSCDTCHGSPVASDAWRTDCTFCHGEPGVSEAPPRQIDGALTSAGAAFPAHRIHTDDTTLATPFGCDTCHVEPTSVLSPGHLFIDDDTPGVAEVAMAQGTWDGASCTDTCHGAAAFPVTGTAGCGSCHSVAVVASLSGEHAEHANHAVTCDECHDSVTPANPGYTVTRPEQHMNGTVDITLPVEMTRNPDGSCTGTCHLETHTNATW